jgi:small-conductance mechanosensitive channel/CRP-like cAMP-binding protein
MTTGPLGERPAPRRTARLVLAACAIAAPLAAGVAHASPSAGTPPTGGVELSSGSALAFLTGAVLLAAFATNRFAPEKRRHMRDTAVAGLAYLIAFVATVILGAAGAAGPAIVAREFTQFFGLVTAINLAALVLFDLVLSALGLGAAPFLGSLVVILGDVGVVVGTLRHLGVELSGILATSALLSTITAFSLQSTLANIVGGLALHLDEAIRVGDWVQLENGRQGKVREIRWRYTVIETRDWDTMIVPNSTILASSITILGKRQGQSIQHRMWIYFNVDFRYSPTRIIEAVNLGLQAAPIDGVASEPKPHTICFDFAKDGRDSFGYYAVRYWLTDLARDDPTSSLVRERIYTALKRADIPLAMPAAHVWIEQDAENRARRSKSEIERREGALNAVEFLRGLRDEERTHIRDRLKYSLFAPGETITKQGAVAHWLYIIVGGLAEVRVSVDGTDKCVAKVDAPGFVGEMGLMTGAPRTATVVAITEVQCYRLDKEAFNTIMVGRPEIANEISAILASRTVELSAVRDDLDVASRRLAVEAEHRRLSAVIKRFFGLDDDSPPSSTAG